MEIEKQELITLTSNNGVKIILKVTKDDDGNVEEILAEIKLDDSYDGGGSFQNLDELLECIDDVKILIEDFKLEMESSDENEHWTT